MKKSILLFSILLFVGSTVFQSCKKDDAKACTADTYFQGSYYADNYVVTYGPSDYVTTLNGVEVINGNYAISDCNGDDFLFWLDTNPGQGTPQTGHFESHDRMIIGGRTYIRV